MMILNEEIVKKIVRITNILLLIIIFLLVTFSLAFAHSGGTDSNGGHYDHDTGEYHYHHGLSAHQHNADGTCPLDENYVLGVNYRSDGYNLQSEPKTKSGSKSKTNKNHVATKAAKNDSTIDEGTILGLLGMVIAVLVIGLEFFGDVLFPVKQSANNESTESNSKTYCCPYCGAPMVLRNGKYGLFYVCSRYPDCYGTRNLNGIATKKRKKRRY